MRLMFVVSSLNCGGAERHTLELASALSARGHVCDLVAIKAAHDEGWARTMIADLPAGLQPRILTLDARGHFDRGAVRLLSAELRQRRTQVVIAVNGYALIYATRALRAAAFEPRQRPALAMAFHSTRLRGIKEPIQHALVTPLAWNCDLLIFVCDFQYRYWRRRGLHARHDAVIHNGIQHERYSPAARARWRGPTRATLGYDDADFVLGCCAQLRPEKNHQQLVDAVIALRMYDIPARALIVGEGRQRPLIERYVHEHAASAHVTLVGHQDEVERYIAAFDVGVLCSVAHETFSLAALEQMAMGVPMVLSDQGGAREMVSDDLQGFVFPTSDTTALVQALRRLYPLEARQRMGAQAALQVTTRFRHVQMLDRYETLFESLVGSVGKSTASALQSCSPP